MFYIKVDSSEHMFVAEWFVHIMDFNKVFFDVWYHINAIANLEI